MCPCVTASPEMCIAKRYAVSLNFVSLVGGCNCRCHFTDNGAVLPTKIWLRNRQRAVIGHSITLVPQEQERK